MTNQEKWDELVNKIEELGDELNDLLESIPEEINDGDSAIALFGLRLSIDELREQEIPE
jgi:hypothetical protein